MFYEIVFYCAVLLFLAITKLFPERLPSLIPLYRILKTRSVKWKVIEEKAQRGQRYTLSTVDNEKIIKIIFWRARGKKDTSKLHEGIRVRCPEKNKLIKLIFTNADLIRWHTKHGEGENASTDNPQKRRAVMIVKMTRQKLLQAGINLS